MWRRWLEDDETFMFTYGDGVTDLDLTALIAFHHAHGKDAGDGHDYYARQRVLVITFDGSRIATFYESRRPARAGSTVGISSSTAVSSTTSTAMTPSGNAIGRTRGPG